MNFELLIDSNIRDLLLQALAPLATPGSEAEAVADMLRDLEPTGLNDLTA